MAINKDASVVENTALSAARRHKKGFWLDICIVLFMGGLLYYGASWQFAQTYTDTARYECYAVAFWQGVSALQELPTAQCAFMSQPGGPASVLGQTLRSLGIPEDIIRFTTEQSSTSSFHVLPYEYPLLTLLPFTMALLVPLTWYQWTFGVVMLMVAVGIYITLLHFKSRRVAILYALYLVVGCWATALARFDLIPAWLTLLAVIYATRKHWNRAFALLAVATMFKFYPLVLIVPFLLAQHIGMQTRWYAWRSWQPLSIFIAVCFVVGLISLSLSVEGTLAPLSYFGYRPVQVESFTASLLWITSLLAQSPLRYEFTYGSLNVDSPFSSSFSLVSTVLLVAGLFYTYWLQWRRKISLAAACLLTLLIVMLTGKVFSPQYLIWVVPLVAYIGEDDPRWVSSWIVISILTTWVYPNVYLMVAQVQRVPQIPLFYPITTARNVLMLIFVLFLLFSRLPAFSTEASLE